MHNGAIDRVKQSAIYVNIGKNGQAYPITASKVKMEEEKNSAKRYQRFVSGLIKGDKAVFQDWINWLKETFKLFFESSVFIQPRASKTKV